jgi:hypothetical protein
MGTVLQRVGEVFFEWDGRSEICISRPVILKIADIEAELYTDHHEASNTQLYVCTLEINLIVIVLADREIRN